jgi:hypothetical protein
VKVGQEFNFAFHDKWTYIFRNVLVDYIFLLLKLLKRGEAVVTDAVAYSFLTPQERRHTLQIGVSTCVASRRVPGPV